MQMTMKRLTLAFVSAGLMTIYGCGGGSSTVTPSGSTLQGVAATGAAFVDAVVTIIDSTGAAVGTSLPVGTDGIFNVTLASGAKPPYLLVASRTTADGEVQTLVSVAESASVTIANITPITNLIASRLTPTGDPLKLVSELAAGTANITPAKITTSVAEVKQILLPLLTATGTSDADPLKGTFSTNGAGYDRLLDSIKISITPANASSSNIEIAVKQQQNEAQTPVAFQFTSSSVPIASPLPTIEPSKLVESGTSVLIADFLKSLTACFALPLTDRINASGITANDIKNVACKNVFFGNIPSSFLNNGKDVGLNKAFDGIFTDRGTGAVFSQGSYEFTRTNGDLVIGYKSKSTLGNENFDTFVVRKDIDGKLKLIGNQYNHPGGVSAFHQFRQFITLDQLAYNYHSTGYNLNIEDIKKEDGISKFNRVVVSTPSGAFFTLKPKTGFSYLTLMLPNESSSNTTFIRLRSVYANGNTTPAVSSKDSNLYFAATAFTDLQIAAIPAHSVWIFKYYLTTDPTETPAIQTYKTRSRALTIEELKHQGLAKLSDAVIATMQSQALLNANGMSSIPTTGPIDGIDFTVPPGALPVTSIKIFGKYNSASFEDSVNFGSTARTGTVKCAAVLPDVHCSDMSGTYKSGNLANGLHLYSRDASGREYSNFYAMYKLTNPTPL